MAHAISIVHGARSFNELPRNRPAWPEQLAEYLLLHGYGPVRPFFWSGSILDGFSGRIAKRYADHLDSLLQGMSKSGQNRLSIIGKSMGPMIAEGTFARYPNILESIQNCAPGAILRIATPDIRRRLCFPDGFCIFDIISKDDKLFAAAKLPLSLLSMMLIRRNCPSNQIRNISLHNVTHREFNSNSRVPCDEDESITFFSLYESCLHAVDVGA